MSAPVLDLPRSVTLAAWLPHVRGDAALAARAVAAVTGDDEPHQVVADDGPWAGGTELEDLVLAWSLPGVAVAAALPVPGDVVGVPAPASSAAVAAGECALVQTPTGTYAAVPQVERFGSATEPGHVVAWQVLPVAPWTTGLLSAVGALADAERDLREALRTATEALDRLDVARWREDAVAALASLRAEPDVRSLPSDLEPRRGRVLALAARLRVIVDLATNDDGGAVNVWQADQRSAALRHVDHAARRAACAATLVVPA